MKEKAILVYYVRHGETLFNVTERTQGWCDSPLTEDGIKQARKTKEMFSDIHFDYAYVSPAGRATDTAKIILENQRVLWTPLSDLKEIYFGTFEGSKYNEFKEKNTYWEKRDWTPIGGESAEMVENRIRRAFKKIYEESTDGTTVLVISHRGYFFYMLHALFGVDIDKLEAKDPQILQKLIPNASYAMIRMTEKNCEMIKMPVDSMSIEALKGVYK